MEVRRENTVYCDQPASQCAGGDFSTRYKFNGKELDKQTGYYYYGARYYDPVLSRWLGVDPLAEKYPGFSPYNYTFNNPLIFIDPTGKGGERATDEWIRFSTGEVVRVGDKGGDERDYIHKVDIDGNITTKVVDVKKSYVSISGTEIPTLIDKSPGLRVYDATPPAIKQVCVIDVVYDLVIDFVSEKTGINRTFIELASMFINPKKGISSVGSLLKKLKRGSKGYKLAEKLLKFGNGKRLPTPSLDKKQFRRVEDYWVHIQTGSIYKKSYTSHGNPGNAGTQWKIYPKNTTEFGKQAKKAAYRVTIDSNGNIVGY